MHFIAALLPFLLSCSAAPVFLPASTFSFLPADRWSSHATPNGTVFESKWGSATALASSAVNATAAPHPTALGLVYLSGSSDGHLRVTVNGQVITELDTFSAAPGTHEFLVPLRRPLPNLPLWVLSAEATGVWTSGSKDSYVQIAGVNVYY